MYFINHDQVQNHFIISAIMAHARRSLHVGSSVFRSVYSAEDWEDDDGLSATSDGDDGGEGGIPADDRAGGTEWCTYAAMHCVAMTTNMYM